MNSQLHTFINILTVAVTDDNILTEGRPDLFYHEIGITEIVRTGGKVT